MRYIFKNKFYIFLISLIDFFGAVIFLPFNIFKRKVPGNIANILVIRLDHIGDVIFSTSIARNLKERYRGAKITFLVAGWSREVVMNNPYIDEVICYNTPWFSRHKKVHFEFIRFFKLASELRKHNYDLGFDLRGDFRHILLMFLGGVKFRVGYGVTGGGFLLHREAKYSQGVHTIEHNHDILRNMGVDIIYSKPSLYSSQDDKNFVTDFLIENSVKDRNCTFIVHSYAGYPSKNWLDGRFSELTEILYKERNANVIFIGSEKDKPRCDTLIQMSGVPAINAAGKTTIGGLFELLKRADIFIGIDSGPSHIAALADKPAIILYSGTNNPDEWGPISDKVVVIQKDLPCKGCQRLDCSQNICMDLITVDDVIEAVDRVLGCR